MTDRDFYGHGGPTVILGGSFDPVHAAHTALAVRFCGLLKTDRLAVIPTGNAWQKAPSNASAEDRAGMVRIAFSKTALNVYTDFREIRRSGPSYTVDTLTEIRALSGNAPLVWVIGADQLANLSTWHRWRELFGLAHLAVSARPGFSTEKLPADVAREIMPRITAPEHIAEHPAGFVVIDDGFDMDLSSTEIRRALKEQKTPAGLDADVLTYIRQHGLYTS